MTNLVRYATYSRVLSVEERFHEFYESGVGQSAKFSRISRGYFVLFSGSYEAIHLGPEPPAFKVGDEIKITFEKVERHAQPSQSSK